VTGKSGGFDAAQNQDQYHDVSGIEGTTSRASPTADPATAADEDLVRGVEANDAAAIEELYRRHAPGAKNYAKSLVRNSYDADDAFSEAFFKVVRAIQRGKGPTGPFRPYLLRAVKTCAADQWDAQSRQDLVRELEELPAEDQGYEHVLNENDRNLAGAAFASLPVRWQTVLWHLDVEGDPPRRIAPLLGIEPNAVSAVALRARRGLRKAYLEAYTLSALDEDCQPALPLLVKSVLQELTPAEDARLRKHLDECHQCTVASGELRDTRSTMRLAVGPWFLGIPAASTFDGSSSVMQPGNAVPQAGLHAGGMNVGAWAAVLAASAVAAVVAVTAVIGAGSVQPALLGNPEPSSLAMATAAVQPTRAPSADPLSELARAEELKSSLPSEPAAPAPETQSAAGEVSAPFLGSGPDSSPAPGTEAVHQLVPPYLPPAPPPVTVVITQPAPPLVPLPTGTAPPTSAVPTSAPGTPTPVAPTPTTPNTGCAIWIEWWLCL
jgi:RNA polymerase sigma factor (sigma-70 family)